MSSPIKAVNPSFNASLKNVWSSFAEYDDNAKRQQVDFNRMQIWVLILGVIATTLALSKTQFADFFQVNTLQDGAIWLVILV